MGRVALAVRFDLFLAVNAARRIGCDLQPRSRNVGAAIRALAKGARGNPLQSGVNGAKFGNFTLAQRKLQVPGRGHLGLGIFGVAEVISRCFRAADVTAALLFDLRQ